MRIHHEAAFSLSTHGFFIGHPIGWFLTSLEQDSHFHLVKQVEKLLKRRATFAMVGDGGYLGR